MAPRTDKHLRAGLYARVSTEDRGQDPETQLRPLREYAERRGFVVVGEFVDHASGTTESRPRYQKLLEAARKRELDVVLVWRPPAYSSLRHRLAVRGPRGGARWTRTLGWARARRSAPHTLAEAGPRPSRGGACRRAASGRPCCGCCGARTWSWSRASSASPPPS